MKRELGSLLAQNQFTTARSGSLLRVATATATAETRAFFSQTPPLLAEPGKKRSWLENFWEVNRRTNVMTKSTGKPIGPTAVRTVWADVRAVGGGMGPFPKEGEGSGDSTDGSVGGKNGTVGQPVGKTTTSFNISIILLILCSLDLYRRMFMRSIGNGEIDYPYQPYTVVSKADRAKHTIMNLLWPTEAEKEAYKAAFFQARRQRPLLTFWQYMDEAHPGWNNGNTRSGSELVQAMQGAVTTSTEYSFVQLTNKLHSLTSKLPNSQARVDVMVDHLNGMHADNPAMRLAASMAGAQGNQGGMPTMRMTQNAEGQMVLTDQHGNQIPVQSMQSLNQSGGLTFQPTGRVADGGSMPHGGGNPMIISGAPPGSTITSVPFTSAPFPGAGTSSASASNSPEADHGGDHGTVPLFKS